MIGDLEHATFSNIEHQSLEFVRDTLNPWLVRIEQAVLLSLIPPSERTRYFVRFNIDGMLRGDYKTRIEGYVKGLQNGIYSVNDVLSLEDMNLVSDGDGGNLRLVNGNTVKLQDAGAAYVRSGGGQDE
jgi:HK97 family phage portal protein